MMSDTELVEALLNVEEGLDHWEVRFVESIGKWVLDNDRNLTPLQRKKAEGILDDLEER